MLSQVCGAGEVGVCDARVLFVSITCHSQSAKDIHSHFKSQLYVEVPGYHKPGFILANGLSKQKLIFFVVVFMGFEPTTYYRKGGMLPLR